MIHHWIQKDKQKIFKSIFGHKKNYDLIINKLEKLNEVMEDFCSNSDIINIINEASTDWFKTKQMLMTDQDIFYGTQKSYRKSNSDLAIRMGMEVLDYIAGDDEFFQHQTAFPNGPTGAVSYFPVGTPGGSGGTDYLKDRVGRDAYDRWSRWAKYLAQSAGYEFVSYLGAETTIKSTKKEPKELGQRY